MFDDLPPLPPNSLAFGAFSLDTATAWDTTSETARTVSERFPPDAQQELDQLLETAPQQLGFDLRDDLLASLGSVHCVYSDPAGGPLGMGFGVAVSVKDARKLRAILNILAERSSGVLNELDAPVPFAVQRAKVDGRELLTLPAGMFTPTVSVDDKWMVFGLYPQTVRSFHLRQDGRLPRWPPSRSPVRRMVPPCECHCLASAQNCRATAGPDADLRSKWKRTSSASRPVPPG